MITIKHTHADGTLIDGTARGDGSAQILKRFRCRWSRNLGSWYVPQSRDRAARGIEEMAAALREGGFEVSVDVDDTRRSTAEVQADRIGRSAQRAHGLAEKAQRLDERAAGEFEKARLDEGATGIPFGQPILVGHHSERRHRRTIERAENAMRRGVETHREAEGARNGAAAAAANVHRANDPRYIGNRIADAERDVRAATRGHRLIDGGYTGPLPERLAEAEERLAYWRGELERVQTELGVKVYTKDDIAKGDAVLIRHGWAEVVRANPKTVSCMVGMPWPLKYPYAEIRGHRTAAQLAEAKANETTTEEAA